MESELKPIESNLKSIWKSTESKLTPIEIKWLCFEINGT